MTKLLTITQAADLLQCHERTVRRAIEQGLAGHPDGLRAHRVGAKRAWRIREADLEEWLDRRASTPPAPPSPVPGLGRPETYGRRSRRRVGHLALADRQAQDRAE